MSASETKLNEALAFHQSGEFTQAKMLYEEILAVEPNCADALYLLGIIYFQTHNFERAIALFDQVIANNLSFPDVYFNRGLALQELKQWEAAIESYDHAIAIQSDFVDAFVNRGNALQKLMRFDAALKSYETAISINSNCADAYVGCGIALQALHQLEDAVKNYDRAIAINTDLVAAYGNRGNTLVELQQLSAAVNSYSKAFALNPHFEYLLGLLIHTKMKLCDWSGLPENIALLVQRIERGEKASQCFPLLSCVNSLSVQRKVAETWMNNNYPQNLELGSIPKKKASNKIRIGYFSADFHFHAVSILLAQVFELHDKNRFEIIAFSLGPNIQDDMRSRLVKAFDQFIDVRELSDKEVAMRARQSNIDIAVDLTGTTIGGRVGVFAHRAAPVQVSYLGFLGTMGADYYDYLIADSIIIPEHLQHYYSEKIVYLPSYQANDSKRVISAKQFTRQELGLPESGFIFCCFNNNYKITPATFDGWMRILNAVKDSVLFLYAGDVNAEQNLRKEALTRGIDPNRLVFGKKLPPSDYLARFKVADLFLDTFPYNAGTTASDALWAGLLVLTLRGETFASRVAASVLTAIGLPELVTESQEAYETLAIDLATHPEKLAAIKTKLADNRSSTALFNTPLFTKHIENAYTQMVERYHSGLMPGHIYVG